ncbi:Uncharacterised protein [Enterobacter ludwigii]|nr:Uncharacterised protein [Enterobacter ludwigii]
MFQFIRHFVGQNFTVLTACQLDAWGLKITVGLISRAVLTPESAIGNTFDFKLNFGKAFGRVARHQIVLCLGDFLQARRFVIQRQTNGVEQGRFPCAGSPGNRKQSVAGKRLRGKIDFPLTLQ